MGLTTLGMCFRLPPMLMEKYLAAADKILDQALPTEARHRKPFGIFPTSQAGDWVQCQGRSRGDGWANLVSLEEDDYAVEIPVPAGGLSGAGEGVFAQPHRRKRGGAGVKRADDSAGTPDPTQLGLLVGPTFIQDLQIDATEENPKVYEARVGVPGGKTNFRASVRRNRGGVENETFMLNGRIGKQQPGIVFVRYMEIEGPLPGADKRVPAKQLSVSTGG